MEPLIMDTLKSGQPPYNGQTVRSLPFIVHAFLPLKKGQPLKNGQNARPQCVHYSTVEYGKPSAGSLTPIKCTNYAIGC